MQAGKYTHIFKWVPIGIILLGIALRLWMFFNGRGLWTDEVAVALNIAERNFTELLQPLNYKQYAPPIFLWMIKLSSALFGYGEKSLRLIPFLSGLGVLAMFYQVLKQFVSLKALWYPLLLLATGVFYMRYSVELKQYMSDTFFVLTLVWLAKKLDIDTTGKTRFAVVWLLAGSIAVWSSMPSVFVLAGVGCYYGIHCIRDSKKLMLLVAIAAVWLSQFLIYYFTILNAQVQSEYLVAYHSKYFLVNNWASNKELIKGILEEGFSAKGWIAIVNSVLMLVGICFLSVKRRRDAVLILLPVVLLLIAAYLKQYSLIPRLTLFIMPLLLLLVAVGIDALSNYKPSAWITGIGLVVMFVMSKPLAEIQKPWHEERMKEALEFIQAAGISNGQLYVYTGAIESYRYYTEVHPEKERWSGISKAYLLNAEMNIDSVLNYLPHRSALLYTIPFDSYDTRAKFEQHGVLEKYFEDEGSCVFIFKKKG